jgi:hypothetical protein
LYPKSWGHSDKPLDNLTFDAPHAGTDNSRPSSTELEPVPKNSEAPVTERLESSLEILETPAAALEMIWHEEDTLSFMLRLVNRDQQNLGEEHRDGSTQTLVAGDASSKVDGTSSVIIPALITSTIQVLWRWTTHKEPGGSRLSLTPPFSARLLSRSLNVPPRDFGLGLT